MLRFRRRILPVVVQSIHIVKRRRYKLRDGQIVKGGEMNRQKLSSHRVDSTVAMSRDPAS